MTQRLDHLGYEDVTLPLPSSLSPKESLSAFTPRPGPVPAGQRTAGPDPVPRRGPVPRAGAGATGRGRCHGQGPAAPRGRGSPAADIRAPPRAGPTSSPGRAPLRPGRAPLRSAPALPAPAASSCAGRLRRGRRTPRAHRSPDRPSATCPRAEPPRGAAPAAAWSPPPKTTEPVPTAQLDGGERKFFTFVVLHAGEDEIVAHRVKNLLESMGVPNGATLCEDFSIAGCSHLACFQDAMENSAFMILLLTKNFACNLCMFQTDTALMESIQNPSKHHSVIPFVPKENPLKRSQIPSVLGGLVPLDENSPMFSSRVQTTFKSSRIKERKAMWDQMQRRKLQLHQDQYQAQQSLASLSLGHPQQPLSATQPQLLQPPPQEWCPPTSTVPPTTYPPPLDGHPTPAQLEPPPFQALQLPSGHYSMMPGPGGIIIQHARMIQIGNHNTMQVETVTPGPQASEEESRQNKQRQ
ncbi:TIR domain-containing adapter molecule 1 [Pogoniulus pusillus]|uniref:TIR domain-containing adapter molecule 1 n=1 Tax=Pogoniulus pusillus TaxID=488313 RepID=UPI0030B9593B